MPVTDYPTSAGRLTPEGEWPENGYCVVLDRDQITTLRAFCRPQVRLMLRVGRPPNARRSGLEHLSPCGVGE